MLEIGEYVRTKKYGDIGKLLKITSTKIYIDSIGYPIDKDEMAKHSKNIIDLIEVGDYVNGYRILEIHEALAPDDERILDIGYGMAIFEDSIETILTKEQYEANCYKLEEEK